MRIRIVRLFSHGGIEEYFQGRYNQTTQIATVRSGPKEQWEQYLVMLQEDGRAVVGDEPAVWRNAHDGWLEVELYAGS